MAERPGLIPDDRAIAYLPVILMAGVTVTMGAVAYTAFDIAPPEKGATAGVHVSNEPDQLRALLTSGGPLHTAQTTLVLHLDHGEQPIPLSTLGHQLGPTWDDGEAICIAGSTPACDRGVPADRIQGFRIVSQDSLVKEWTGTPKAAHHGAPSGGPGGAGSPNGGPHGGSGGGNGAAPSGGPGNGNGGPGQVTICHIPPGNPDAQHTITVGEPAVDAHLDHGDHRGPCRGT